MSSVNIEVSVLDGRFSFIDIPSYVFSYLDETKGYTKVSYMTLVTPDPTDVRAFIPNTFEKNKFKIRSRQVIKHQW